MEQYRESPLFGLSIDPDGKSHLAETAKWARFLAIAGFIGCGLLVLFGFFFTSIVPNYRSSYSSLGNDEAVNAIIKVTTAVMYTIAAVLWFFPLLFLYRFATRMKAALLADDQTNLNESLRNLKKSFRFVGILTIIGLVFYVLAIIIMLIGAAATL